MASTIELTSGSALSVREDAAATAQALRDAGGEGLALVELTRRAGYQDPGTVDGQPVYVNPACVASVTAA